MKNQNLDKITIRKLRDFDIKFTDILNTAEVLFKKNGFENTTMNQIAEEAGYSKGTVYNVFKSKNDLYFAIGVKSYQILNTITEKGVNSIAPGLDQLLAIGQSYHTFTKKYPKYAEIMHEIGYRLPKLYEESRNELTPHEKKYIEETEKYGQLFMEVAQKAIKLKEIRTDKNPLVILITLSTMTSGFLRELSQREFLLKQYNVNSDEIVNFVFEMIAKGLKIK